MSLFGVSEEIIDNIKKQTDSPTINIYEMFLVAKALGKALKTDIYTAEELEIVAKVWNKQLSQCENFIRQQQINELIANKKKNAT